MNRRREKYKMESESLEEGGRAQGLPRSPGGTWVLSGLLQGDTSPSPISQGCRDHTPSILLSLAEHTPRSMGMAGQLSRLPQR